MLLLCALLTRLVVATRATVVACLGTFSFALRLSFAWLALFLSATIATLALLRTTTVALAIFTTCRLFATRLIRGYRPFSTRLLRALLTRTTIIAAWLVALATLTLTVAVTLAALAFGARLLGALTLRLALSLSQTTTPARSTWLARLAYFGFDLLRPAHHHERVLRHYGDVALDQAGDVAQVFLFLMITEGEGFA